MHRTFWAPPRYEALCRYVASHPEFDQRTAAEATGYSLTGLHRALARLAEWGCLILSATRGRLGRTRVTVQSDVRLANVSPTGETSYLPPRYRFLESASVAETFPEVTVPESWTALRGLSWNATRTAL